MMARISAGSTSSAPGREPSRRAAQSARVMCREVARSPLRTARGVGSCTACVSAVIAGARVWEMGGAAAAGAAAAALGEGARSCGV